MAILEPDWHLYRAFLAVVREGTLSGAARALGMTQPTVGRQVAALEDSLGVTLFMRSLDGLAPTKAGLRLIPSTEAMAAAAEAAQRAASGDIDEERGTVRIAASEVIGGEVLPSMLVDFRALHPRIAVELALSNRNEDLLRGDADIAVRMVRPTQGALIAKRVGRIDVGLHAHRRYLKGRVMPQRLEDLGQHALIGYDQDPVFTKMIAAMGAPVTRDTFTFRSDSNFVQLAALRAGFGIGACQLGIARQDHDLVPVLHDAFLVPMEVWVVLHPDLRGNRRIRLSFDYLVEAMSRFANASRHAA